MKRDAIERVAVIGAGTIGTGWATFYAARGLAVRLADELPEVAEAAAVNVAANLRFMEEQGFFSAGGAAAARDRLQVFESTAAAVEGVELVQEAVFESYQAKGAVFALLDELTPPEVPLASSSSGLLMTEIQASMARYPERALIAHPIHPVYLVPLVELVPGARTDLELLGAMRAFYERLGKVPVSLNREVPGYLENRLTAALWREAIDLVHQGVASVEDVDRAIWAGPGLRYALMGPLLIYHLGGGEGGVRHFVEHLGPAFSDWWQDMNTWTELPTGALDALEQGLQRAMGSRSISEVAAWRDGQLVKLLRALAGSRPPEAEPGS